MTIDKVGIGTIRIELKIQGLKDEDWQNLQSAEVVIIEPDGNKAFIPSDKIQIDKTNKQLIFNFTATKDGEHVAVAKLNFEDGKYTVTYEPYRFYVANWWDVAL